MSKMPKRFSKITLAALSLAALSPVAARAQLQDLYVDYSGAVARFAGTGPGTFSTTPDLLTGTVEGPSGLAFDMHGNLFAASIYTNSINNGHSSHITEFAAGATKGTFSAGQTVLTGVSQPYGLAFDALGDLFVANGNFNGSITEYAAGAVPGTFGAVTTLTGNLIAPGGLAFDSAGDLFAANQNGNSITEFAAGATPGTFGPGQVVETGLAQPTDLAFDKKGDLFVVNEYGGANFDGSITEFAAGATPGTFGVATSFTDPTMFGPNGLAFDALGNLYVVNHAKDTIAEFTAGATPGTFSAGRVIETGLNNPLFLTFGPLAAPAVPEASTTASFGLLLALGMGGLVIAAKRKKQSASGGLSRRASPPLFS